MRIADLDRVNVFIGPNNCGKSNILRAVKIFSDASKARRTDQERSLDPSLDYPVGGDCREMSFGVQVKRAGQLDGCHQIFAKGFGRAWANLPELSDSYWVSYSVPVNGKIEPAAWSVADLAQYLGRMLSQQDMIRASNTLLREQSATHDARAKGLAALMHSVVQPHYDAYLVDAFRRIVDSGENLLAGAGLIGELRRLQSPDLSNYQLGKIRFNKINGFLQDVLAEPDARLEIPAALDQILVTLNGKVLPLESLGTGIHELIILAAAVTLVDDAVFCLEEPEIHLHPALQKKFMWYIRNQTANQYIISTHSNAFFDLEGVSLYSCSILEGRTICAAASSANEKHAVLQDLGYRPSDLPTSS